MSKKPYIIQRDSPNLVIVPTDKIDAFYEPAQNQANQSDVLPNVAPSPSNSSVFVRKTSAKLNYSGVNSNVLIDVHKVQRSSKSWATNFLESIGGPSTKVDRIYSLAPKSTSVFIKPTTQQEKEIILPNTVNPLYHTELTPQIMKKTNSHQKINTSLLQPSPESEPTMNKETSKPNYSKISTNTSDIRKLPSLPKNYKIPMQSKYNKLTPTKKETNSTERVDLQNRDASKNQSMISSYEKNDEINKQSKNKMPDITINKETTKIDTRKEPSHDLNVSQCKFNLDKTRVKSDKNSEHIKHAKEITKLKRKKAAEHNEKYHTTKCNGNGQPVHNKEYDQAKHNKDIKQHKATLSRNKDQCPPNNNKENTIKKTKEDIIAHIKTIKEIYKLKKKQEPLYATKFKTKKEHISVTSSKVSKISKHSKSKDNRIQESRSKKYKDKSLTNNITELPQTRLTNEDIHAKRKNKLASEKKSSHGEPSCKSKINKHCSPDSNESINKKYRSVNEERLSISPIKSVVSKIKTDHVYRNSEKLYHEESGYYQTHYEKTSDNNIDYHFQNSEKYLQKGSDVDLRTKLKRKNLKKTKPYSRSEKKDKFVTVPNGDRFVPEENLIISFNAKEDGEEKPTMNKSTAKKLGRKQSSPKDKKCKKIKLEINIVFGQGDTSDEESAKSEADTHAETTENMDLSFLDDFNVDEIAESLNECNDSTKTHDKVKPCVDSNVRNSICDNNEKVNAVTSKDVISEFDECFCKNIISSENKDYYQNTESQSTETNYRHQQEENKNTNITKTNNIDLNQGLKNEIKTALTQITENTVNCCIHIDEALKSKCKENIDIEIKDKKINATPSDHKADNRHTDDSLQLVSKLEYTEFIGAENCSEIPEVMPRSETNIYSDHNDLIDALQDNNNLEINAIKSYIASTNNTPNEINKIPTNQAMSTTVSKYSITPDKTDAEDKDAVMTSSNNMAKIFVKEDPEIILIDDSDTENETEMKNSQPVKVKNAKYIQTCKESHINKSEEITIIEPAEIILDESTNTNARDIQAAIDTDKYDEVSITELGENSSESTLILETSAEDIQLVKECGLNKSDEPVIIVPNGENSESILILDTDYDIENNSTQLNKSNQIVDSKNILLDKHSEPYKIAQKNNSIEAKTNTPAEINIECTNITIQNQVTNDVDVTAKTDKHNKDLRNTAKIANTINSKPSDKSPRKETTAKENIKVKCTPTVNTKTQNVNTKPDTVAPSKSCETRKEKMEINTNNENKGNEKNARQVMKKFLLLLEVKLNQFMGRRCTVGNFIQNDGKFSRLFHCKDYLKQDYAIKSLKKRYNGYNLGPRNQNMMMELQNAVPENNLNCVRYITGFMVSGFWCVLMEYFPMNLHQALAENKRSFHIDHVQLLSRQLVSAVTILRNNNIIHSDIKPRHILINAAHTRIKLCGFDQASYLEDIKFLPSTGTVNYRAPELILGYPAGYGIDVWSTALVVYEMATNRKLFHGNFNNNILYQQLCTLGPIPMGMLVESQFSNAHFRGTAFMKSVGRNEAIVVNEIEFTGKLNTTLFQAYTTDWGNERLANKRDDKAKIRALSELLHSMLAIQPECRIAIEFVFANPFIYESFDNC